MDSLSRAPRRQSIPLPPEMFPFALRSSLSAEATPLSFSLEMSRFDCPSLTADDFSRPATNPPTNIMRIVHPALIDGAIIIRPAFANSNVVTVGDVLQAIHAYLTAPIQEETIPPYRKADVVSYFQSQSSHSSQRVLKRLHFLEGSTIFAGLIMDVGQSNRILGIIDELQSRTWILVTTEEYGFCQSQIQPFIGISHMQQEYPADEMGYVVNKTADAAGFYPTPPFSDRKW